MQVSFFLDSVLELIMWAENFKLMWSPELTANVGQLIGIDVLGVLVCGLWGFVDRGHN